MNEKYFEQFASGTLAIVDAAKEYAKNHDCDHVFNNVRYQFAHLDHGILHLQDLKNNIVASFDLRDMTLLRVAQADSYLYSILDYADHCMSK